MAGDYQYGPYLKQFVGGNLTTTAVRSWVRGETTSTVRRPKPQGIQLLLKPTAYVHQRFFRTNVRQFGGGNYTPSSYVANESLGLLGVVPEDLGRLAWASALERLQNNKFDTATFIGELPETVRWIAGAAKEMMDAYLALRRGRWVKYLARRDVLTGRKGRKYIRLRGPRHQVFMFTRRDGSQYSAKLALDGRLARRYLEWRFAVQPLVSEVGNLLDAYYEQALNPMMSHVRGYASDNVPLVGHYQKGTQYRKVIASGYYEITTSAKALQKWGGINLVSTMWNLVPLSFMVDRFIPIGQFLANLDAEMGVVWRSVTTSVAFRFELRTFPPNGGFWKHETSEAYGKGYVRELKKFAAALPTSLSFDRLNFQTALDLLALTRTIGESLLKR